MVGGQVASDAMSVKLQVPTPGSSLSCWAGVCKRRVRSFLLMLLVQSDAGCLSMHTLLWLEAMHGTDTLQRPASFPGTMLRVAA